MYLFFVVENPFSVLHNMNYAQRKKKKRKEKEDETEYKYTLYGRPRTKFQSSSLLVIQTYEYHHAVVKYACLLHERNRTKRIYTPLQNNRNNPRSRDCCTCLFSPTVYNFEQKYAHVVTTPLTGKLKRTAGQTRVVLLIFVNSKSFVL